MLPIFSASVDQKVLLLFYLHGRIVEQSRRPTHPQFGVYEYDQILDTFKQDGFVVISEQRKKDTAVEEYGKKVAGQVRHLLEGGVPAEHITVVGGVARFMDDNARLLYRPLKEWVEPTIAWAQARVDGPR